MTLDQWISEKNKTNTEIARLLGVSRPAVYYWRVGIHRPSADVTERIGELTSGAVTAIDLQRQYQKRREDNFDGHTNGADEEGT